MITRMRLRLLLRQATSSVGASIAIIVIVAVAAGLFTAWPRTARATFVDEFNFRIEQTPEVARALTGRDVGGWFVSPWSETTFEDAVQDLHDGLDDAGPTLAPLLGEPELLTTVSLGGQFVPFETQAPGPSDLAGRELRFRAIQTLADHVTMIDGDLPQVWDISHLFEGPEPPDEASPPIPVAFSAATADRLGVAVGDELALTAMGSPTGPGGQSAVVSGIFEATEPDEVYWSFQISSLEPLMRDDPMAGLFAIGAAYVHPDTVADLQLLPLQPSTEVWAQVDPGTDDAAALLDDLRELTAREIPIGQQDFGSVQIELETALIEVLEDALAAQAGTAAVLTLVAAGPVGVTFALLALSTRLSVSRRRATLALASARGGSPAQIRGGLGIEGLVLGLPAAAVGAAVGTVAVPGAVVPADYMLATLAGLAPAAFLATAALPNLRTQRHDLSTRSSSSWRSVLEILLVSVTAAAVYLLLSRGLQATTTSTVDPLATATPLLIALSTAVLATRFFPLPMRLVHAATRRRRDLTAFLGSARAIREGGAGLVPMLALLVATSIAVFSTTMLTTLASGVGESSRAATGADVRLGGPAYTDEMVADVQAVPGVSSVTRVLLQRSTRFTDADDSSQQILLLALDTGTLSQTQEGVDGAVTLPEGMDTLIDDTVPVLVSSTLDSADGDVVSVQMSDRVPATVVGSAPAAAGLADRALWAVVDLDLMREVTGQNLVPRLLLVDLEPGADPEATSTAIHAAVGGEGTITTVEAEEAGFLASPSATSMQRGFVVALVLSVVQSVLALVLTLVLAAPARGRLVAVLRTLGMRPGEARRLVSWELVPLATVAIVAGTALGLGLPHLVVATVDLSVFTGVTSPPVVYDWQQLALVLAGVVAVVALTLLVASTTARRLSLTTLRIGDAT